MRFDDSQSRWKAIRRVVFILLILFVVDILLLLTMIPLTFYTGVLLFVQIIVVLYFTAVSMGLLKKLKNHDFDE